MLKYLSIFFLLFSTSLKAENLVIVDIDYIIKNSKLGKNLINNLKNENGKINEKLKTKENEFLNTEKNLVSKKNILSEDEFQKEFDAFKEKISQYNIEKQKILEDFDILKKKKYSELFEIINNVLLKYSKQNNIVTIIDKKYVIISKSETDITQDILDLIDNKK